MEEAQFQEYAKFYDLLYKDKDYTGEARFIDALIKKYSDKQSKEIRLLDLACGTGKHLFKLNEIGYEHLEGSDIAAQMIAVARERASFLKKSIKFHTHSFQDSYKIDKQFDVVISMFSAIDYLTNIQDQNKSLQNIYNLLKEDGIFIFDFWNGNAVVKSYSPVKVLRKQDGPNELIRISETKIDPIMQDVWVKFSCQFFEKNHRTITFEEVHHLHYYFFSEIKALLQFNKLEMVHMCPFMNLDSKVSVDDWNISIVVKKMK